MRLLEERLRQMEAVIQGERLLNMPATPHPGSLILQGGTPSDSIMRSQPRSLSRQGAILDLSTHGETPGQQARADHSTADSHALVPITTLYEPGIPRTQALSQSGGPPRPSQPFLGLQSLSASSLSTSHVNQARQASAATMLQHRRNIRPALGAQGAAPRTMLRGPSRAADHVQGCYTEDGKIRLQVRVYPPDVRLNFLLILVVSTHLFSMEG